MTTHLQNSAFVALISVLGFSCEQPQQNSATQQQEANAIAIEIVEKTDAEYPDNPDIGFRASNYSFDIFENGRIETSEDQLYTINLELKNNDSLVLQNLDLTDWIPTIPDHIKEDDYLSYLAVVNQEWNRNQVAFREGEFVTSNDDIVRVDLARNCLNAYLWEVILYTDEGEKETPVGHGWYHFPEELYAELFEQSNKVAYAKYKDPLEEWHDPQNLPVDRSKLRSTIEYLSVEFADHSDAAYPLGGARLKKFKEIVYPEVVTSMRDLQNDSTTFATFTPPGLYNRADPRTTELGRFVQLDSVSVSLTQSTCHEELLHEIELAYTDGDRETHIIFGGLDFNDFPTLAVEDANNGWKHSMGFGNHTFYESLAQHSAIQPEHNPYFAYICDGDGNWLDSHKIGIDGPLIHKDIDDPNKLHIWLLSFERHALVGHYVIDLLDLAS